MFDLFRSRDKAVRILLGVILGVVALSMVTYLIPGGWMNGGDTTAGNPNVIAKVGDYSVTAAEAQRMIQNMMRGRNLPPEILSMYAPQMINNLIAERAMAYEAKRLGFVATEAETADAVRRSLPPQLFKDGKLISKDLYSSVLAEQGMTIEQFEAEAAQQVITNRLRDMIAAGVVVSPLEVEQEYRKRNEKAKIDYVILPTAKYSAEAQASDAELKAYFDKHRAEYQLPEKRNLAVLVIDPATLQNDFQPSDAELQTLYQVMQDKFRVPERVKVRHILIKSDPATDAQAKAKIDDIEKQLQKGADFADLARRYSQDPGSASKGGDLDWITRNQTVKEFEAAAFSLPLNKISEPVKTTYGYHILEVMDKQAPRTVPFEEAKSALVAQLRNRQMNDILQTAEDKAVAALRKDPAHPEKAAEVSKAQIFNVPSFGAGDPIPGVGMNKEVDAAIVSLKKGQVSQPVVLQGNKIVIADVMDVSPARPASFEDVQGQIRTKLNTDKVQQVVTEKAKELLAKAKADGGDLKKAAKEMGLEVKTSDDFTRSGAIEGVGSASTFADAFTKPVNSLLGPVPAQGTVAVAEVVGHTDANMAEFPSQRDSLREEIKNTKAREREEIFIAGLKKRLEQEKKIQVHNDVLKQVLDSYTHS